jgi:hypothetical protein
MSIYKDIDQFVVDSCKKYKCGIISVGTLKDDLLKAAQQIVSLEDKEERYFLQNAEAEIDGKIAIYYGTEGIDNLCSMYITSDKVLYKITINIINKIIKKFTIK